MPYSPSRVRVLMLARLSRAARPADPVMARKLATNRGVLDMLALARALHPQERDRPEVKRLPAPVEAALAEVRNRLMVDRGQEASAEDAFWAVLRRGFLALGLQAAADALAWQPARSAAQTAGAGASQWPVRPRPDGRSAHVRDPLGGKPYPAGAKPRGRPPKKKSHPHQKKGSP